MCKMFSFFFFDPGTFEHVSGSERRVCSRDVVWELRWLQPVNKQPSGREETIHPNLELRILLALKVPSQITCWIKTCVRPSVLFVCGLIIERPLGRYYYWFMLCCAGVSCYVRLAYWYVDLFFFFLRQFWWWAPYCELHVGSFSCFSSLASQECSDKGSCFCLINIKVH